MNSSKCIEFNKYLQTCKKKSHLSYYDYQALILLTSLQQGYFSPVPSYDIWQIQHEVTNEIQPTIDTKDVPELPTDLPPINNVSDLLQVIDRCPSIQCIKPELEALNAMIGMQSVKNTVVNQILYYAQNMHMGSEDYKHTVIMGPPGTGKTEIAKLLGSIFSKIGDTFGKIGSGNKDPIFKKAVRADLIAGYVGQTAIKTKALIEKCMGGVLFIDEAYSFGDDTFSKECVDTLCESLSAHRDNLTVIIAGYEDKLQTQFFALNPGLESRFTWRYTVDAYTADELHDIFMLKVKQQGWTAEPCRAWFSGAGSGGKKVFTGYGRDMESLLFKVKVAHSRRFFSERGTKKHITLADMNAGYKMFLEHKESKSNEVQKSLSLMYV